MYSCICISYSIIGIRNTQRYLFKIILCAIVSTDCSRTVTHPRSANMFFSGSVADWLTSNVVINHPLNVVWSRGGNTLQGGIKVHHWLRLRCLLDRYADLCLQTLVQFVHVLVVLQRRLQRLHQRGQSSGRQFTVNVPQQLQQVTHYVVPLCEMTEQIKWIS